MSPLFLLLCNAHSSNDFLAFSNCVHLCNLQAQEDQRTKMGLKFVQFTIGLATVDSMYIRGAARPTFSWHLLKFQINFKNIYVSHFTRNQYDSVRARKQSHQTSAPGTAVYALSLAGLGQPAYKARLTACETRPQYCYCPVVSQGDMSRTNMMPVRGSCGWA